MINPMPDINAFPEDTPQRDQDGNVAYPTPGMSYRSFLVAHVATGVCFLHREDTPEEIADRIAAITDAIMKRSG